MPQNLDEKQARLMKNRRYFSCKKKGHTIYNYSRNGMIPAISKSFIEDNSS